MAETHELRLKIDAGAARSGAKQFTSAVESVRKAVAALEKDSAGAFTSLRRVDTSGLREVTREAQTAARGVDGTARASDRAAENIRKLAIQSANSLRVSTDQASRLRDRLLSVGDTQGLAKLEAGLARLRTSLTNATSGLDVREARAQYADLASELNRTSRESERLRAESISVARAEEDAANAARSHATALENLRARYDSTFRVSKQYEAALRDINTLEQAGALSAAKAAQAREQASQSLLAASAATDRVTRANIGMGRQLGLQINQMGQVAGMATSMEQALKGVSYQAADIGLVFGTTGIAIGTVAGIALPLLIDRLYDVIPPTKTVKDALEDLDESIEKVRASASRTGDYEALRAEYGALTQEVLRLVEVQERLARIDAAKALREARDALFSETANVGWLDSLAGYAANGAGQIRMLRDQLNLTTEQARAFADTFGQAQLTNDAAELADHYANLRQQLIEAAGGAENLDRKQADVVRRLVEAEDAARQIAGGIDSATGATNAWAGAMSGVRAEINAILSSLASIGGGVISNASKSVELQALEAGKSVRDAAIARERYRREQEFAAKEMAADARGGVAGWLQGQMVEAERYQMEEGFRLDAELDAARAAARKAARSSSSSGSGRTKALTDEQKAVEKLTESLQSRLTSLQAEKIELELLASGQFQTAEGAAAMAEAMTTGTGVVDAQTAAMVRQIDAAAKLNDELKRLANDPVNDWIDSVPDWVQAGQKIEAQAIESLSDAIAEFAMTGEFNFEKLGQSILATATKIIADMAVKELIGLLGGNVSGSGPGGFNIGGILGGLFGGAGVFHEGGIVGAPTTTRPIAISPQALAAAPRYHEGTPNTGLHAGEHVAVLRDHEAVIPLTRGRAVPVDLGGAGGGQIINMPQTFHIATPDADSFRKSRDQIARDMAMSGQRAMKKNG